MKPFSCIILSLTLAFLGCAPERNESTTRGHLHALIAESTAPAMVEQIHQFLSLHAEEGADVTYEIVSSDEAIRRMMKDTVRFIVSTRPLTTEERKQASAVEGYELNQSIIAYDGIVVVVNKANTIQQITVTEVQKILDGTFSRWEQLSSKGNVKGSIDVLYQESSDASMFAESRILQGHAVKKEARRTASSLETLKLVGDQRAAIGLVGVLWVDSARVAAKVLKVAQAQQPADSLYRIPDEALGKFFSPHPANIYRTYYPLKRAIYVITLSPFGTLAAGLGGFMASPTGQRMLLNRNIVPGTQRIRLTAPEE